VTEDKEPRSETILVVDDVKMMRSVLRRALESGGYDVIEAQSGADAILKLEQNHVRLMISDILMPDMDGMDLVKKTRSLSHSSNVPILMCTGKADTDTVLRLAQLEIQGYIVKPVDERVLLNKVREAFADAPGGGTETPTAAQTQQAMEKKNGS
jgi:CheY-like chemotaxis protein